MKIIKNIEEYFTIENVSNTSVSLITLDKAISVEGKKGEGHSNLFYELIKLLFKYNIDCGEYNFINIRYVKNNFAVVVIPAFITYFQLEELNKINRILKNANLEINSYVNSFNPITKRKDMKDCYFDFSFLKTNKKYELLDIEIKRISSELKKQFNYDFVKKIDGGYSGAISLQLEKNNKKYFCKVCNYNIDFNYIKNVLNVYEQLNINSLKLVDNGTIFNGQYYFVIYNYIDGICLNNYIKENKLSDEEIINYGFEVGKIAKKLKDYKKYNKNDFEKISIANETNIMINNLKKLLNNSEKKGLITKYISIDSLKQLIIDFNKYSLTFENENTNLIHQDLKSANIMICNNEIYVIDIEYMALSYNVFDFKCTITWELVQFYEYEINYLKGYFNGLYDYKVPKELLNQLKYIFLYDFFRSITVLLNDSNINYKKIENYLKGISLLIYTKKLDNIFSFIGGI